MSRRGWVDFPLQDLTFDGSNFKTNNTWLPSRVLNTPIIHL